MPEFRCSRCGSPLGKSGLLCEKCLSGAIMTRNHMSLRPAPSASGDVRLQGGKSSTIGSAGTAPKK